MIKDKIIKSFSGKNVLITGGTGLIGRQVVDILGNSGANIRIVSLDDIKVGDSVEHILGDLTDFEFCKRIIKDMDFVFHLAGIKASIEISKTHLASHFVPTLMMNTNVLEASRVNNVEKLVYTSSIGAYTEAELLREENYRIDSIPMDFAGWAKRVGELQIYAYKTQYKMENFAIVRPSNVYGPGDNFNPDSAMVIPSLMSRILREKNPLKILGDGTAIRDFVYSRDVAEGVILALYHGTKGGFLNLGSGRGTSIKELVITLNSFIDFNYEFDKKKQSGPSKKAMDITLAKKMIGYNPTTTLLDGLRQTWDWFVNNKDEYLKRKDYFKERSLR